MKFPKIDLVDTARQSVTLHVGYKRETEFNIRWWLAVRIIHVMVWIVDIVAPFRVDVQEEN